MFPPTPTALPVVSSIPVDIHPSAWRIWQFTDEAIGIWNRSNDIYAGYVIQIATLVIIVIAFVAYVYSITRSLTSETEL